MSRNYWNYYNLDIPLNIYYSCLLTLNRKNKLENAPIHKIFLDIEVYIEDRKSSIFEAVNPINAISFYFTRNKTVYTYVLKNKNMNMKTDDALKLITDEISDNYMKDLSFEYYEFETELDLIKSCWAKIRELDPAVLSGWNSDSFDYPYIYKRLLNNLNNDFRQVNNILSAFGEVRNMGNKIKICEYPIADLLYLYKPREDGGLSYGSKNYSYKLDSIAEKELKKTKIEYKKSENSDLNSLYDNDPYYFIIYNIVDVLLCGMLDQMIKHIDLHNNVRFLTNCSFEYSLIGSSSYFENYITYKLMESGNAIRFGIVLEKKMQNYNFTTNDYLSIIAKFDGAYVKNSYPTIISDGSLVIDLDAKSLYPSMMIQHNISFDTYDSRVLSPSLNKFMRFISEQFKVNYSGIDDSFYEYITKLVTIYCDSKKIPNKKEQIKIHLNVIKYLFNKLKDTKFNFMDCFNPHLVNSEVLGRYFMPLIDIMYRLDPNKKDYNEVCYDYFYDTLENFKERYTKEPIIIISNVNSVKKFLTYLTPDKFLSYTSNKIITISGCLFTQHTDKIGLFTTFLKDMNKKRDLFKHEMEKYAENTEEYTYYDYWQLSIKKVVNSSYGVTGLSTFKFSNHWMAQTVTASGKNIIKLAIAITEDHLNKNEDRYLEVFNNMEKLNE